MIIKSLNQIPEKYGMSEIIEYNNDDFKGHQIGLCIGIKNNQTGELKSYVSSKDPNISDTELLEEFLKEDFLILEDTVNNIIEDELVLKAKTIYYVPYYVVDHSVFQPTPNYSGINFSMNIKNKIKYEVLFVSEDNECNRYVTLEYDTAGNSFALSCSFLDIINDIESDIEMIIDDKLDNTINTKEGNIVVIFYDKIGQPVEYEFSNIKQLLDRITSVRIIDCEYEIL